MEKFTRLFDRSIRFAYHCFDRIVIRGYLSALSRPENIEYFFRTIKQVDCISKETLRQRTDQYLGWVDAYTRKNEIPMAWAQKDVRKSVPSPCALEPSCRSMPRTTSTAMTSLPVCLRRKVFGSA